MRAIKISRELWNCMYCLYALKKFNQILNHKIHVTTYSCSSPHGVWKVVKFQKYCLFWASWPKKIFFDMPQDYSAKKNHKIDVTTLFVLMTTIWWPHVVWKLVKFQKYCLFWVQKIYVLICHKYIVQKKTKGGHDHITLKHDHISQNRLIND